MRNTITRRSFLKTTGAIGVGIGWGGLCAESLLAAKASTRTPYTEKLGWRLACAAYTFRPFPFTEALDRVADLGLAYIEGLATAPVSSGKPPGRIGQNMSATERKDLKKRLADKGVKLVGCYYDLLPEVDYRKAFDWAKEMEIEYLASEPPFDSYETLDKLCREYKIKLAIHNHATPTPDVLAKHLRDRSPWMGACCDTGHWVRRGLEPVEMMKILEGRLSVFHLKDLATIRSPKAGCVPFGTGKGNIEGILREAKRQGFRGVFTIEYEPYSPQSYANVAECIVNFKKLANKLL